MWRESASVYLAAGLLAGSGLNYGFVAGAALGFTAAKVVRPTVQSRFGRPTAFQIRAMNIAIGTELVCFLAIGLFAHSWSFDRLLTAVLFVVSAHFLIMALSHGPAMLALGAFGLGWLWVAVFVLHAPVGEVLIGDGALKLLFGGYMAAPLMFRPPIPT